MRKVIFGSACSLDGFVAGKGGSLDWLHFSRDAEQVIVKAWASADTILMGRKAWESAEGSGGRAALLGFKIYVFSRTLAQVSGSGAQLVTTDAGAFVRELKTEPGKDILVLSGGGFATSLLQAGVIDEIGLNIHPVLLGTGVAAFLDPGARVSLELTECRQMDGGCVLVTYRVKR